MGINVKNLVKTYGDAPIVHGISFTVENSEFVTLLGPSGCGKTTTLRCIAGLERTNAGVIEIDGHIVSDVQKDILQPDFHQNIDLIGLLEDLSDWSWQQFLKLLQIDRPSSWTGTES